MQIRLTARLALVFSLLLTAAAQAQAPYSLMHITNSWRFSSSTTLGTTWRANAFDDSGWSNGVSVFDGKRPQRANIGGEVIRTQLLLTNTATSNQFITYYFRSQVVMTNDPSEMAFTLTNLMDDGAVFYVNGTERFRTNMPNGAIINTTLANVTVGDAAKVNVTLPGSFFDQGANTLAVEVHQSSATSSDITFGLGIQASFLPPGALVITRHPQSQTNVEGSTILLQVTAVGTVQRFQWFKDSALIPGATASTLTLANLNLTNAGSYYCRVSNTVSTAISSNAIVTVLADTNGPVIVDADGTLSPTEVHITYDETVTPSTATNTANYVITNTLGGTISVTGAVLTNATNVILTTGTARATDRNYILIVNNVRDTSPRLNLIRTNSMRPIAVMWATLVGLQDTWDWYQALPGLTPEDPGSNWMTLNFFADENIGWALGSLGGFYFDPNEVGGFPVPGVTGFSTGWQSLYFRKRFVFTHSPLGVIPQAQYAMEDGGALYWNGVEFDRYNMRSGPIPPDAFSLANTVGAALSSQIPVPTNNFYHGSNILAAELHTIDAAFETAFFTAGMTARILTVTNGPVIVTSHPESLVKTEGQPASFSFVATAPTRFQWQRNGTNIPGATNYYYEIAAVTTNMNGTTYRVIASNGVNSVTTSNALLTVIIDTNAPFILAARANTNRQITVYFSEPMDATTATTVGNYTVTNSAGTPLILTGAAMSGVSNVVLTANTLNPGTYTVVINNLRDASVSKNLIAANSRVTVGFEGSVIGMTNSTWRYNQNAVDLGTAWRASAFNDTAWTNGFGLLGVETPANLPEALRTTLVLTAPGQPSQTLTYYFRGRFTIPVASTNAFITIQHIIDDGAVFYLNGQEFYRIGVPAAQAYATLANRTVDNGEYEGPFTLPITNLVAGENVIAVEVHQVNATSSDIVFGMNAELSIPSVSLGGDSTVVPVPPAGIVKQPSSNITITWTGTGFVLQQNTNVAATNAWLDVPGATSPYSASTTNSTRRFFRLRR